MKKSKGPFRISELQTMDTPDYSPKEMIPND